MAHKKRHHHQSKKSRMHEHMGMEMYERGPRRHSDMDMMDMSDMRMHHNSPVPSVVSQLRAREPYADRETSRKMMMRDGGMIHDDWSAPALQPRQVMDKQWPRGHDYMGGTISDLFMGVQRQLDEDAMDMRKVFMPKKY